MRDYTGQNVKRIAARPKPDCQRRTHATQRAPMFIHFRHSNPLEGISVRWMRFGGRERRATSGQT
jgi:hypothetical protein